MSGFIRRYPYAPGTDTITLIEGVVVVDLPPPGSVNGVGTGTVALIGEFPDMTYGTVVDASANVTTKPRPVEVLSAQDMLNKVGGWDETIGEFGVSGGNGFAALRNKKFSRLILVPINLCSAKAVRAWRELPTNASSTNPNPVVPMQAAVVAAGREFKASGNRVRLGAKVTFTDGAAYATGTDGAVTASGSAATQSFGSSSLSSSLPAGKLIKRGDVLVVGVIGAGGAQGINANTYRVQTTPAAGDTAVTVEKLDGSSFDWSSGGSLAWRLHDAVTADSAGVAYAAKATAAGYTVPARPLDATVASATKLSPTVAPPTNAAASWDPLSGLAAMTDPATGLVYTAAVQGVNAAAATGLDTLYSTAVDSLLSDDLPARDANVVWAARVSATIRTKLRTHVADASSHGLGRMAVIAPDLSVQSTTAAIADADPGVGANRDERVIYDWPGARHFVPEAAGYALLTADGSRTTDGILDDRSDGWMASVLSNLPPERNPGQAASPVKEVMAPILGFQRGVSGLAMTDYIQLKQRGIAGLRIDRTAGPIFQSGKTASLTSGQTNVNRRRMADFIEDSLAQRYVAFSKLPLTNQLKDGVVGETDAFLTDLLSPSNPPAQRISDYHIDAKSGNTLDLEAKGVFVVIVRVRTLATADVIVLQAEIGEGVKISTT